MMRTALTTAIALALAIAACSSPPAEVGGETEGSTGSSGSGSSGTTESIEPATSTGVSPGTSSGSGSGSGDGSSGGLDSTGTSSGTTAAVEGSGSSSEGTTGEEVSSVGCADGVREALLVELDYPNVAACAGGFWVPGVASPVPQCDRQGGNDGPFPDGMGCSIEDLCAAGWHLCTSRHEVAMAGLGSCEGESWGGQFFATSQSGEGANTCNDTGTNDVFGCGDVGYSNINGCAPLNRSTSNLCLNLPGAWACSEDAYDEVSYLVKPGPDAGGALCCRDGA